MADDEVNSGNAGERVFSPRAVAWLVLLLIVSVLFRLPGMAHGVYGSDGLNYCVAALKTGIAHPPGYCGYVWLGKLVNGAVGHINRTFMGVSLTCALASIVLTYVFARQMGLGVAAALASASIVSANINLLVFSTLAMNFTVECALALGFACLGVEAIRQKSFAIASAATVVFAAAGSIRPTTTAFLLPLWMYVILRSRPRVWQVAIHLAIAAALISVWQTANSRLLAAAGFRGTTYDFQVMIAANYDYTSTASQRRAGIAPAPTFHMPAVELMAWIFDSLHLPLLPHHADWPTPSLARAVQLSGVQAAKLAYFLLFTMPLLVLSPLVLLPRRTERPSAAQMDRHRVFLLLWIAPAGLFFVFGHLGSVGYLLFFTPPITIWIVFQLMGRAPPSASPKLAAVCWIVPLLTVTFYDVARPFRPSTLGWRFTADTLALQNTAAAEREHYSAARSAGPNVVPPEIQAMTDASDDAAFLVAAEKANFSPIPPMSEP